MFQNSLFALVAAPFNFIGLFFALIIIAAIAFYVWANVHRLVVVPDRRTRERLNGGRPGDSARAADIAKEDIDHASMSLDEKSLQEEPIHTVRDDEQP
ncbi:MAG: hypothetical protein ACNA8W_21865 [Bradymonadaceae bacterium]